MIERNKIRLAVGAILAVTFIAFYPSLNNAFTNWDDEHLYLLNNVKIRDLSWKNIQHIFSSTNFGGYEPLTEFSFALEYHFFKLNPRIYHATNLLLHLLNCLLVFKLINLLSRKVEVALITALFFGVHPLHVESVAWVSERKDVLYAFFFLASLISYIMYRNSRRLKYYYGAIILFLISLLAKPQGIVLPLVLLLFDYFLDGRVNRKLLAQKIPFIILAVIFIIITVVGQTAAGELRKERVVTALSNLPNGVYGLAFYLIKLMIPIRLSCFYAYPEDGGEISPGLYLLSPFLIIALMTAAVFSTRLTRKVILAGLFFLINISVVLQVIPTGPAITADRYVYISSIGIFYIGAEYGWWLYRRKKRYSSAILPVLLMAITGLFSFLTWERCQVWKGGETLWRDVLKKYKKVYLAHNNLANMLVRKGRLDEAISHYRGVLRERTDNVEVRNNLALTLLRQDKLEEAIAHFNRALEINPDNARVHNNLGFALSRKDELGKAISHYLQALRIHPGYAKAHNNLGIARARQGRYDEAIVELSEALRLRPDYAEARRNLEAVRSQLKGARAAGIEEERLGGDDSEE